MNRINANLHRLPHVTVLGIPALITPHKVSRATNKQVKYLESIVSGVYEHHDELNEIIGKFSIGWDVNRISRFNRVIMQLAIYEILYVDDVPEGVAISEAVRLAKKYNEEMGKFINGILGAFVRSRKEVPAEAAVTEEA